MNWLRIKKSISMQQMKVGGIQVDIVKKDIKNLHLAVYPPSGRVRIAVPLRVNDESIRLLIVSKLSWIKKQQKKFAEQERQSEREYVTRESHYYQGRRYLLNVNEDEERNAVVIKNKRVIDLRVKHGYSKEEIMKEWYRAQLKKEIQPLLKKWQKKIGVEASYCGVRLMKTKWGSCNISEKRIWINLELAKKPKQCLEYIIVHELVHLLERHHNDRYKKLMDTYIPQWRAYKDELNRFPISHPHWGY